MTDQEIKDLNLSYQDMEFITDWYINYCYVIHKQAKSVSPDNKFVKQMGGVLYKFRKFSPKQLESLLDIINK